MVHLPKIAPWHGVLVPPRQLPLWIPLGALAGALLLAVAVNVGLALRGDAAPRGQNGSPAPVVAQVMSYVNDWNPQRDPLITLPGGVQAKASNVYGVDIGGLRYFYQLTHSSSFDPLRTGTAEEEEDYDVVAVIDANTPWEVLIYRLR